MTEPRTAMLLEDAAVVYDTGERDALLKGTHVYLAATPDPAGLRERIDALPRNYGGRFVRLDLVRAALAANEPGLDVERVRAEYQRFYAFVADADQSIVDAWHFTENARLSGREL